MAKKKAHTKKIAKPADKAAKATKAKTQKTAGTTGAATGAAAELESKIAALDDLQDDKKKQHGQITQYTSFRLQKRIKSDAPKLPGGFKIFRQSLGMIKQHWKVFFGILCFYALFNVILVQSFAGLDLNDSKQTLESLFAGQWSKVISGFSIFAYLVGSSTATGSQTAAAYQFMLLLITSLASIWTLRHTYKNVTVRIRDAFYMGMYPLIPFLLVLAMVILQLLPILIGSFLYGFVGKGGAVGGAELALWVSAIFLLSVLSLYMISSSVFALYIVCLPDMTPLNALRSARALVKNRRWLVMRRVLFLPFMLLIVGALVMVPTIMFITPLGIGIFFALTVLAIPVVHAYMYRLYRELL